MWNSAVGRVASDDEKYNLIFNNQAVQGEYSFQDGGIVVGISNFSQTK
jgi:hypothetical protein